MPSPYIPWLMDRVALVTGGRDFTDRAYVWVVLNFHNPSLIVHGGATGVDTFADQWARRKGLPRTIFAISDEQWRTYGKVMGRYRNNDMMQYLHDIAVVEEGKLPEWDADYPSIEGIVFPGGNGTHDMMERMIRAGMPWWDYRDHGQPPTHLQGMHQEVAR